MWKDDVPKVQVNNLAAKYTGKYSWPVLKNVNFSIQENDNLALIGPAGSGKTALAKLLAVSATEEKRPKITSGSATVLGVDIAKPTRREKIFLSAQVGFLPHDAGTRLIGTLSVGENIALPIIQRNPEFDRQDLQNRVAKIIDQMRLPLKLLSHLPAELSSGQRQRVALAKSLIMEPALWIADEPTRGLDISLRDLLDEILREQMKNHSFSSIIISHDFALYSKVVSKVLVLEKGEQTAIRTSASLRNTGALNDYVAELASIARQR